MSGGVIAVAQRRRRVEPGPGRPYAPAAWALRDYSWPNLQLGAFAADILMFGFLFGLALRTEKYWPLAAAGFQLLAVMTHLAKMADRNVQQWAYMSAQVIWTYLVMTALAVGAWNAWRARRQPASAESPLPAGATRR